QADFDELTRANPEVGVFFAATHHGRIRTALGQLQQPRTGSAVFRTAVADLLRSAPVSTGPQVTIAEAARRMTEAGVSSILLMEEDRLVGILTDRDLRRRVVAAGTPTDRPVREVMTLDPVTISSQA